MEAFGSLSFPRLKLEAARYMAPEGLDVSANFPSKKSDVYSLAMTSFTVCSSPVAKENRKNNGLMQLPCLHQVLTGILPYEGARDHYSLVFRMKCRERPSRPTDLDGQLWSQDNMWNMLMACWSEEPDERWEVSAMYDQFLTLSLQEVHRVKSGD